MSLILDALKRAERERQASETNSVVSDALIQDIGQPNAPVVKSYPMYLGLIIPLVIILFLVYIYFKKESASQFKQQDITSQQISTDQVVKNRVEPAKENIADTEKQASAMRQAVTDLYQKKTGGLPKVEDVEVAQLYTEPVQTSVSVINPLPEILASVGVTNPLPDESPQLPKNLQAFEVRRIADVEGTVRFDDLSFNQKQLFPSISYSQHNYLGSSASSVVINGQLMRTGSRVNQDLTIIEIVEDGVIFNYYNRRVSFKALNGWINM